MKVLFTNEMVKGCEVEIDKRTPGIEKKALRVDFGSGISTRFPLHTPGLKKLGVGVLVSGEFDLNETDIRPWNIKGEGDAPDKRGYSLNNIIIKKVSDGEKEEDIKIELQETNWDEVQPTRERVAFTPRTPAAGTDTGKGGGAAEAEEQVNDLPV